MGETQELQHGVLPPGIDTPATTVLEALQKARALLEEEGRWIKGSWYENHHPEVDPKDPFCNSWHVCAEGAVAAVIYGASCHTYETRDLFTGDVYEESGWDIIVDEILDDAKNQYSYLPTDAQKELFEAAKTVLVKAVAIIDPGAAWTFANQYNDDEDTTRDDVLEWFDEAIKLAVSEQNGANDNG